MSYDQVIKIAAIVAGVATILVSIALFFTREYIESNRRRKQSSTILALYGYAALRALERSSRGRLHFSMKDVLEGAREVIHIDETRALVSALDAALYSIESVEGTAALPVREERQRLADDLAQALGAHVGTSRLSLSKLGASSARLPSVS